ncbi:MAG: TldD/PmbA family protein [Candidatus Margulisiibacteriota bacterium]|nr:TldD/PmbA family protein [Candidatus Margulisiibacteriota bacterium]
MLSCENMEEILQTSLRNGGDFAEVFIEESRGNSISCEDDKIEKISSGTEAGAGIRVINGKETAYIASSATSFEALREAALKISDSLNGEKKVKKISLRPQVNSSTVARSVVKNASLDEKTEKVHLLNKTARSFGSNVKQVTVRYADTNQAVSIANSDGIYVEDNRIRTRYYINVIVEKNGILQTGYEAPGGTVGFELFDQHPPEKNARRATERALRMLDAPHAPAGKMMVVLHSDAGGTLIHEACGHALEADFIMKGTSIFGGKVGKKVASELVTVVDDATMAGKFGTYAFDDEGTPGQKTILIENGTLKGFLSDRYNAKLLNIPMSGNGRRESYKHKPVPRMTNTIIAPGKMDPDEIVASVQNGLLVKRMGGGQVDVVNGDFVFEITEGYLIENGKIKYPVRGAILTGNGPKVLEIIDMVGSDLGFQTGVCGKFDHAPVSDAQPTIRIPEIVVGGRM